MSSRTPRDMDMRQLEPEWNSGLITASITVSLLGAFTSTQMMCQARTSRYFSGVLVWTILGSLTFGFCSIWSLHFIAMLACELDVPIGLNVPLTALSAVLAVVFTFVALIPDLLSSRYLNYLKKKHRSRKTHHRRSLSGRSLPQADRGRSSSEALLPPTDTQEQDHNFAQRLLAVDERPSPLISRENSDSSQTLGSLHDHFQKPNDSLLPHQRPPSQTQSQPQTLNLSGPTRPGWNVENVSTGDSESIVRSSMDEDLPRRSSGSSESDNGLSLPRFMSFKVPKSKAGKTKNALSATLEALYEGATWRNVSKGFVWSLAISSMHYVGILALEIPQGRVTLRPLGVLLSALISWLVCSVGCILIPSIEVNLSQQVLFASVAATGVAAMHFTGMWATTFWSHAPSSEHRGYPPRLAVAVSTVAIGTCILANGLLAHSATMARNKLAEVVQTKRKLWAAIAQKENAEAAAAARSEFIASASHEIRTPLHQLQGYGDLLARTELTEEGRLLLLAIQQATRSLSMITANVLDWSRLEKGEAVCRPVNLNMRTVCESILNILPNQDDETPTELLVAVSPQVPSSVYLDETYLQRILMNLLTNALKFTHGGYVLLLIEFKDDTLIITVKDSGLGIPKAFLPQLFEPFKQAQTLGAERGTGLGLAIIKQLLTKLDGSITVESYHHQVDRIGPNKCGSTFTVNIPVMEVDTLEPPEIDNLGSKQISIYQEPEARSNEGLEIAWASFGLKAVFASPQDPIAESSHLVWTDVKYLAAHSQVLERVLAATDRVVLVAYDSQLLMDQTFGAAIPSHVVPIKRPFLWHYIAATIAKTIRSGSSSADRTVRFAPDVDVVKAAQQPGRPIVEHQRLSGPTILLVEDNKINQRLAVKMLKILGYNVFVADDGEDAIQKMVEHDDAIDLILMDQSMPQKDGITATREIREMEEVGGLSRRRPILMATAVVGPDAQAMCMSAGADAFLTKPLALSQLESALKRYLE
ncbi:hypothetical protein B0A52_01101 [Exophiala mesophila]|uniref:Histidine kinase n=1 Tax=Exophiala mesophila TaxID=212818 RepID=A0A438NGH0_EXOME|nr:hypothetical protein B0A52_01101 [Exophiala mesophila]